MVMNLYILFLVSLPETFLNEIIILLFAGAKDKLKVSRPNVLRFVATLVLMLTASYLIRPIATSFLMNVILHIFAYVLVNALIYRFTIRDALLGVIFTYLIYTTIENSYYPFIVTYISKSIENFIKNYQLFVLYALPSRIIQIIVIVFLWKHNILLVTKVNRRFHKVFIISLLTLITVECLFAFIFNAYSNAMTLTHQIAYSIALFAMVAVFNLLILRYIYITIGGILEKGYKQYTEFEENAKFALDEIRGLLKTNKVDEAIRLIDELKGKDG